MFRILPACVFLFSFQVSAQSLETGMAFSEPMPTCAEIEGGKTDAASIDNLLSAEQEALQEKLATLENEYRRIILQRKRGEIEDFNYYMKTLDLNVVGIKLRAMTEELDQVSACLMANRN